MKFVKRRALSVFLAILLFTLMVPLQAFATETNPYEKPVGNAEFTVSTSFCASGETTKLFVDISEGSQMSAGMFVLDYDTSLLRATNVETGVVLKDGHTSKNITESGQVKVSYADVNPSYDAGRIFEVEFEAVGDLPEDQEYIDIPINLNVTDLRNYEDYKIATTVNNGKITLINTPYGDVNKSGDITASDALMALYSNSQLVELDEDQKIYADVNGDSKVSAADALLILRYSAGDISNYPIFTLGIPQNLRVEDKAETYVTLAWDEVANAIGYNVYMDGVKVSESVVTELSYTVDGLEQNTKHEFTVEAVNVLMTSDSCDVLSVSTNKADRSVVFKNYDGTILSSQIVLSGENAVPPTAPERKGYTFTGWDNSTENITTDIVITALYEINEYTVTYDFQYDNNIVNEQFEFDTYATAPELIGRTDYTFEGWYRDKNFTKKWDFAVDKVDSDIVLYGRWVTWSEWSTDTSLMNNEDYEVETRTETRYRTKSTTSSLSSSLSGWTKYNSEITSWTAWSNWQNSAVTATSTRKVETRWIAPTYKTVWRYNRSTNGTYSTYALGYYGTNHYIELDYRLSVKGYVDGRPHYGTYAGNYAYSLRNLWWNESSAQVVVTNGYTQYRYQDAVYTYYYYKWSDWSDWTINEKTADSNTEVQTRTVYRYKLKQK